uniref:Uncharacterized protein n=1 Tax=Rhizophora mucronata TaxID=61149 RepID=A0A2P2JYU5_RHIMU
MLSLGLRFDEFSGVICFYPQLFSDLFVRNRGFCNWLGCAPYP